ncbi:MAG: glycosyltransferase family 9 protein [Verrucomicrobiae bacterium]
MSSVLLIKPGSMGDVVHALPVASAIRRAWPEAALTWVVDPRWAPLLEGNAAVSSVKHFPREEFRGAAGWLRAARWYGGLGGLRPDVVVDLQGLLRSALIARCSGGKVVCGLGDAREGAGMFYSRSTERLPAEHAVRRYLRVLPLLGIDIPQDCEFPLPLGSSGSAGLVAPPENYGEERAGDGPMPSGPLRPHGTTGSAPGYLASQALASQPGMADGYVVLHPFARGAGKSLGADAIRAAASEFLSRSSSAMVIVGVGEVPDGLPERVVNLAGKTTLSGLLGILRGAQFVVSVDSGPMHLAAAIGVPLLGIHTWSDPRLVGPYREDAWIWQGGEIRRQNLSLAPLPEKEFSVGASADVARFAAAQVR